MSATVTRKVIIRYSAENVDQPIACHLAKKYDLDFNILKARIFPRREGVMVLELSGTKENFDAGVRFMKEKGLRVEPLSKSVTRNTD
ncbi:MAG TPA: NIL domain-containing protein, partial [Syntrophales bacterium]|nr:NIL domain-containing protein [Syntrophales bacterium]HPK19161.1 NIL domain-containing protein [Syntrophales bacterium]HPV54447.1 NIL domain-containing protein [Syntrophales bacterium]HPX02014.1 NIL domain-containing protein [Syntrophales bacterium]HQC23423.1 NIL domain-containing protein [Syntrophales bacterium]